MRRYPIIVLVLASGILSGALSFARQTGENIVEWKNLAPGADYASLPLPGEQTIVNSLHVVRIDPRRARIVALSGRDQGDRSRTAQQWCDEFGLVAVINAGMYDVDAKTHIGYMRTPASVNNSRWNKTYESVLLLDSTARDLPSARLLDRAEADEAVLRSFGTVIQNLRLIKHPGVNVWSEQQRTWSEAAIAADRSGNILFLFLRTPLSMHQFNEYLLHSPLGIVRAMHAEGGSEASLSVCSDALRLHLSGSMENGIRAGAETMVQMAIPNVVGVKR